MAEARYAKQELAYARGEAEEKSHITVETGYIRRRISVAAVNCFGQRLASRMSMGSPTISSFDKLGILSQPA